MLRMVPLPRRYAAWEDRWRRRLEILPCDSGGGGPRVSAVEGRSAEPTDFVYEQKALAAIAGLLPSAPSSGRPFGAPTFSPREKGGDGFAVSQVCRLAAARPFTIFAARGLSVPWSILRQAQDEAQGSG